MQTKYKYLFLIFIYAVPKIPLAETINGVGYSEMTRSAQKSVNEFIRDYGLAVEKRLSLLGKENAKIIAGRLKKSMRQEYMLDYMEADKIEFNIYHKYPNSTLLLSRMAAIYYKRGEAGFGKILDDYKKTVEFSKKCLKIEPKNGECWVIYGAGLGQYITGIGIFKTISHIREVHDAFEKAIRFTSRDPFPFGPRGMTSKSAAYIGITQFYRICPDWWIMKLITGIRGDKKKAYEYSKEIDPADFERADVKALAVLCYGASEKNTKIIKEGEAIIHDATKLDIVNPINAGLRKNVLLLDRIFTTNNHLKMKDYYQFGCGNIERPANL